MGIHGSPDSMKAILSFVFIAAVCLALDSQPLDASMEMLQETTHSHAAAKTGVKISAKLKARTTMMIGEHEVDAAAVSVAKAQMHKVIKKLGHKHPQFIGDVAGVEDLLQELNTKVNPDCVNGIHKTTKKSCLKHGFTKLKKVLDKVDALENELVQERDAAIAGRRKKEKECQASISANDNAIAKLQAQNAVSQNKRKDAFANIERLHSEINDSRDKDGGAKKTSLQSLMKTELDAVKKAYDDYWLNTEDRALVRNILMQAMWLVCVGFRSFRMHPFCVTLRQQPDFAEPGKEADAVDLANPSETYRTNSAATQRFSQTMKSVWTEQKSADSNAVNREDGDVDMEKGFVNNRAPWGVAPDGTPAVAPAEKEMTHEQLASRLSFLIETNSAPARVAGPIVDFISALQTGAAETSKKSKSLVDTIVEMDTEEGETQAKEDQEWYQMGIVEAKGETNDYSDSMEARRVEQEDKAQQIADNHKNIEDENENIATNELEVNKLGDATKRKVIECDIDYIEFDTIIEMATEELVNIQRLNSLLRFLALGEEPTKCRKAGDKMCTDDEQGTCTWVTRGKDHKGGLRKDEQFCACEYGFYGEVCELRTCPGFGNVRYPATQAGVCMDKGICNPQDGTCTNCKQHYYHGPENKCELMRCPKGIDDQGGAIRMTAEDSTDLECSGKGSCNKKTGVCTCNKDGNMWYGAHCGYRKCPSTDGKGNIVAQVAGTSVTACDGRGACQTDPDNNGKCACSARFQGEACEFFKGDCAGKGTFQVLTGRCMCGEGFIGGGCVDNSQGAKECQTCRYKSCESECSKNHGYCNRNSGKCVCKNRGDTYNGKNCKSICRKDGKLVDWSRSFDKWGWSVCPANFLMTGFRTDGGGDALYNIDLGKCEKPCEGTGSDKQNIEISHCYHENWWKKFDSKGGKFCRRNYFVAGLFRSHCNSLYCLEMAKCCQVKRSLWTKCQWTAIDKNAINNGGAEVGVAGPHAFIAGFYRGEIHTLTGLRYIRQCDPIFYGADYR